MLHQKGSDLGHDFCQDHHRHRKPEKAPLTIHTRSSPAVPAASGQQSLLFIVTHNQFKSTITKIKGRDFPGVTVVIIPRFQCRGCRFSPWMVI